MSQKLLNKLDNATYTTAALMLYIATDMDLAAMNYDSGNYWYSQYPNVEDYFQRIQRPNIVEADELPGVFIGITSLKDPTSFRNGHHTVEAVSFVSYDIFKQWQHTRYNHRPAEYHALKRRLTAAMLKTIERVIPGIADNLLHCEMSTPLSNDHYVRSTYGSSYGTEKTLRQIGPFSFNARSEIQNLFLCGASTSAHGLSGATSSGLGVAAALLDCRPSELLTQTGQSLKVIKAASHKQAESPLICNPTPLTESA